MIIGNKIELKLGSNVYEVNNRDDLVKFIGKLVCDLKYNSETWENTSIENYLEAMQSWLDDIESLEKNTNTSNAWELVAMILLASKMYE